ncbi:MAG: hypothetical protein ACJ8F3_20745 [Xanthobacteraceae bacterium]
MAKQRTTKDEAKASALTEPPSAGATLQDERNEASGALPMGDERAKPDTPQAAVPVTDKDRHAPVTNLEPVQPSFILEPLAAALPIREPASMPPPPPDDAPRSGGNCNGATLLEQPEAELPAPSASPRISQFALLAAALLLSAAAGGMLGVLGASGLQHGAEPSNGATRPSAEEMTSLKENMLQARVELAALKVSIDAANRAASAQFTRIGERIERVERTQAEPAAKLNKALETLDRLSRAETAPPREVTGSITPPQTVGGAPANAGLVDGWVVRDVHRNTALIEGRAGMLEVDKGDVVPGLGRIEAIRKQDGRWIVVTSKGLITSSR